MNKEDVIDLGVATVKGGVGLIPFVGPLFSELIGVFVNKKSKQRFEKWATTVEERLERLEQPIDENNEKFYSAMVKTTQIVAKTHQQEKLEYLANALVNSATTELSDDINQMFLDLIDKYTPSHIDVLKLYITDDCDIKITVKRKEIADRLGLMVGIYANQLMSDGLIGFANSNDSRNGVPYVLLPLGVEFLKFILNENK